MSTLKVVRVIFLIVDVIFLLMGLGMIGVGIWIHLSQSDVLGVLVQSRYASVPLVMIAAGIIVFFVSVIGCIGACMYQRCCLILYVVCVLFVFIMEIAVGIIAYIHIDEIEKSLEKEMLDGMKNEQSLESWNNLQKSLRCCGVNGPADWFIEGRRVVPDSCCRFPECGTLGTTQAYQNGCLPTMKQKVQDNFYYLGSASIGLGVCQLVVIVCGIIMLVILGRHRSGKTV